MDIRYLLVDFNGTLAEGGKLFPGVSGRLEALKNKLEIIVLTADTYGRAKIACEALPVKLKVLEGTQIGELKGKFLERLGERCTAAIGNGFNDVLMLEKAALGIAVLGPEGCSSQALKVADIVVRNITDALDLFGETRRLEATLRT